METKDSVRVGLYGVGLDTYWDQFTGLKDRLTGYIGRIEQQLDGMGATVINCGIVDSPHKARQVGDYLNESGIDLICLYISTYALSSTVLPLVQRAQVPILILNVQPTEAVDYEYFANLPTKEERTAEWLAYCQACSVPEVAAVLNKAHCWYKILTGYLDDKDFWNKLNHWIQAALLKKKLSNTRFGFLGHYYGGMLDVYSDITELSITFGSHVEILEMESLQQQWESVTDQEIHEKMDSLASYFQVSPECDPYELERAARTSCALDRLVATHDLGAIAYYYEGSPGSVHENLITSFIMGSTLLTAEHIPMAGEAEIKNVIAMKIMDLLGAGGSFAEMYAIDFKEDLVLWGHDGPAHMGIAEGVVELVPLGVYHGKPGKGLSIGMSVKHGPVTLLSVVQAEQGTILLVAEGESVDGPTLAIGNTNSRYKFSLSAEQFIESWAQVGPSHHCAIGVGHRAEQLERLAALLGIGYVQVC